jgi:hypothetical protein
MARQATIKSCTDSARSRKSCRQHSQAVKNRTITSQRGWPDLRECRARHREDSSRMLLLTRDGRVLGVSHAANPPDYDDLGITPYRSTI